MVHVEWGLNRDSDPSTRRRNGVLVDGMVQAGNSRVLEMEAFVWGSELRKVDLELSGRVESLLLFERLSEDPDRFPYG